MDSKQVRNIMEAYVSVYQEKKEVEQLDENVQDAVKGALEKGAKFMQTNPVGKVIGEIIGRGPVGKGRKTPTKGSCGYRPEEVETDLYNIILEYLVAEGYADTNEAALAIMGNMSEGWRQSIFEQLNPDAPGNTHSLADLYKAQEKWMRDQEKKKKEPKSGGSGAASQVKGV